MTADQGFELHPGAALDITDIWEFIAKDNALAARRVREDIQDAADWPRDAYFEIIGVIADAQNSGLLDAPRPEVYFPYTITGAGPREIMVSTASKSNLVLASVRREIAATDPDVAVSDSGSIQTFLGRWYITLKIPMRTRSNPILASLVRTMSVNCGPA